MSPLSSSKHVKALDDGVKDGVKTVVIGEDSLGVVYIKIQYVRNGHVVELEHGSERGPQITETEFEVNGPDEYITCIEGARGEAKRFNDDVYYKWYPKLKFMHDVQVRGQPWNEASSAPWTFWTSGRFLYDLTAKFFVVSSALKQLEPQGGSNGHSWDDEAYDGLRRVFIGEDGGRVSSVEFVYAKGDQCITHCHGMHSNERKEVYPY
ncbi:unnamed protein product [Eruca vesicaria subsp. sativa]|uniref:Jacalin-type lectin domain-containing protein n=1 Tax=Eruca vesicaria subsp. sativa TaxID=29727 RepID=A0ABC8JY54_ERUVS|nr:unnamed protein product [Eruca vesicaria subsp. sativa]